MQIEHTASRASPRPVPANTQAYLSTPVRSFHKDTEIYCEGDEAAFFFQVVSGAVRTHKILSDGRRQIDAFHLPGDFFGLGCSGEHRFSAEAIGDASIVAYRRASLEALALSDPALARQVIDAMMRSLQRAQDHVVLLGRKSAVEKIASFLLELSGRLAHDDDLDLPMSRIDIADHLGLTIETVSRSLTQLERDGLISLPAHRRAIKLRNPAALARLNS
jgi:CRP/FNR family nitrogen fixation transcriptional regulator